VNVLLGNTGLMRGTRTPHSRKASIDGVRPRVRYSARKPSIDNWISGTPSTLHTTLHYYAPAPVGEAGALGGHRRLSSVRLSVRLSDVAYIGSNSKTKRPRKTKLCTGVPQVTCDSHTDSKVKRSKVKVGRGHIVAAT